MSWPSRRDTGRRGGTGIRPVLTSGGGTGSGTGGTGPGGLACARVTGIRTGMVTNMALAQRKVLILAADDFEDMELLKALAVG
jgi:hypothetical protein